MSRGGAVCEGCWGNGRSIGITVGRRRALSSEEASSGRVWGHSNEIPSVGGYLLLLKVV